MGDMHTVTFGITPYKWRRPAGISNVRGEGKQFHVQVEYVVDVDGWIEQEEFRTIAVYENRGEARLLANLVSIASAIGLWPDMADDIDHWMNIEENQKRTLKAIENCANVVYPADQSTVLDFYPHRPPS